MESRAKNIRLLAMDVDGVLTDGQLHYGPQGEELKSFNALDGQGLNMLKSSGIFLAVISGRSSLALIKRMEELGIEQCHMAVKSKLPVFESLIAQYGVLSSEMAYVGDDLPDLPILRRAGLAITVPHASKIVKAHSHYVTTSGAGQGAIREVCELILKAKGYWSALIEKYLQ